MEARVCTVAAEVFSRFPGYLRGIVVAHGVRNGPSPAPLVALLRDAEASVRDRLTLETIAVHPRLACWREVFREQGFKPSEYRSSAEAMARRALRGQQLPSINALVDIGNLLSLRHLVPMGGHAIDHAEHGYRLRPASGRETFVPFGTDQLERPEPGEIIFAEADAVLTRRWIWRQANVSMILPETTAIEYNVDALPPVDAAGVDGLCRELVALVERFCGGRARQGLLASAHDAVSMEP
jgi:DNA/RNA-binding domain of Phe-tRNA-synthetase-like protein